MKRFVKPQRANRAAFSLTEVVVAIALLGLGALGVASTTSFAARLTSRAIAIDLATQAVTRVIDSLRVVSCAALSSGSGASPSGSIAWSVARSLFVAQLDITLTPRSARLPAPVVARTVVACE